MLLCEEGPQCPALLRLEGPGAQNHSRSTRPSCPAEPGLQPHLLGLQLHSHPKATSPMVPRRLERAWELRSPRV